MQLLPLKKLISVDNRIRYYQICFWKAARNFGVLLALTFKFKKSGYAARQDGPACNMAFAAMLADGITISICASVSLSLWRCNLRRRLFYVWAHVFHGSGTGIRRDASGIETRWNWCRFELGADVPGACIFRNDGFAE